MVYKDGNFIQIRCVIIHALQIYVRKPKLKWMINMDGLVDGSDSDGGPSNSSPYPSPYQFIHLLYEYTNKILHTYIFINVKSLMSIYNISVELWFFVRKKEHITRKYHNIIITLSKYLDFNYKARQYICILFSTLFITRCTQFHPWITNGSHVDEGYIVWRMNWVADGASPDRPPIHRRLWCSFRSLLL